MDEVLTVTLRDAIYERLDYLGRLVADGDLRSRAALADTEITRLSQAWRALLELHEPDQRGRCPRCCRWRRPAAFPCSVWTVAHRYLITDDVSPAPGTGRHALADQPAAGP
ncbi:hypothetical protein [Amycolatopsis sp. CA-126428]|uniref:hypothetical protein n=1 Tax=Amycolatopsis sp. CA-126428 TaxID=2073158 RepID=UPI000CD2B01A|nr:hypothetical protein [Amycolatopsis sp. CA-126428]